NLRVECTGRAPVHFFKALAIAGAGLAFAVPTAAAAAPAARAPVAQPQGQGVADFYRARNGYPFWLAPTSGDAAQQVLTLLSTASLDGLYPDKYDVPALQQALAAARSPKAKKKDVDAAEQQLSSAFVAYVDDLMRDPNIGIMYV